MTKQRIETITETLLLLILSFVIHRLETCGMIEQEPPFSIIMPLATAFYLFGGCMLQTYGFKKLSLIVGAVVFFILCTCLFYSISFLDFAVFFLCMALVIRKSSKTCDCMKDCENPFI